MTRDEVYNLMKSSKNEHEWNQNCDKVKAAFPRNGRPDYPDFWGDEILRSGLPARKREEWEK